MKPIFPLTAPPQLTGDPVFRPFIGVDRTYVCVGTHALLLQKIMCDLHNRDGNIRVLNYRGKKTLGVDS